MNNTNQTFQLHQPVFDDERSQNSDSSQDSEQEVAVQTYNNAEGHNSGEGNIISLEKDNRSSGEEESSNVETMEPSEIGDWFESQFDQINHAASSTTGPDYLLMEQTISDKPLYFLTLSDTQEHIQVVYGLAKVPTPHQMADQPQVTAFFAPRKVEVPSTMYLDLNDSTKTKEMFYPTLEQIEAAVSADPTIKLIPIDEATMAKATLPALTPIPAQWAEELDQKLMTPL